MKEQDKKDVVRRMWTIADKQEEKFLRKPSEQFNFKDHSPAEVRELVEVMKKSMRAANGIGLSANQIGLPYRLFVAEVPDTEGNMKFYAIFNSKLEKSGNDIVYYDEGCLSVPGLYGQVERPDRVILSGQDKNGKTVKIKAWGLLARVFQHESDHLDGKLFIDHKPKDLHQTGEPKNSQHDKG